MTTNPQWFREMEADEARRQERLDDILANALTRNAKKESPPMKYITIEDEEALAHVTLVMDSTQFVGLYGIPQRGGRYWLAANFSDCGYCETEEEAQAALREFWESPSP